MTINPHVLRTRAIWASLRSSDVTIRMSRAHIDTVSDIHLEFLLIYRPIRGLFEGFLTKSLRPFSDFFSESGVLLAPQTWPSGANPRVGRLNRNPCCIICEAGRKCEYSKKYVQIKLNLSTYTRVSEFYSKPMCIHYWGRYIFTHMNSNTHTDTHLGVVWCSVVHGGAVWCRVMPCGG